MRAVFALLLLSLAAPATPSTTPCSVRLEPSKTWVSLAPVYLDLGELELRGEELVGEFRVRVPLLPSHNDEGTVTLRPGASIDEIARNGGAFEGTALSRLTGDTRTVRCEARPDGTVRIAISTPQRTLRFESRYTIVR